MTKAKEPEVTIWERLAMPFNPTCVEWRAQQVSKDGRRAMALAYIDARSVMARLDEVVGPQNWQDKYRYEGDRTFCELMLRVPGSNEWLTKSDTSEDSNFEAAKGGASGAFKRAAVKWGIGRYLYDVDAIWADCESYDKEVKGRRVKVFSKWTDAGEHQLAGALQKAPPPRSTGRPLQVDQMLDLIKAAGTVPDLRKAHADHWVAVPVEYRKEVLEAEYIRKGEIEREEAAAKRKQESK
jgi:hypothetical protein